MTRSGSSAPPSPQTPPSKATLSKSLDDAISGPGSVSAKSDGVSVEAELSDAGPIGVVVEKLKVRGQRGDVSTRATTLAEHLRPNNQPMNPIEVDPRLGGAVLRSPVDRERRFFEADVTEDSIELTQKRVTDDGDREPADFAVTREQLGEIVEQLHDTFDPEEP